MSTTSTEKFVVYWLGYHENPPAIQSLPAGINVINLFLLNLAPSKGGTTLDYTYITSKGTSWETILDQAHQAQAKGVKVCVSIIPPATNDPIWNTIPDPTTFALNVYNLVKNWKLDGIDIDPEQGNDLAPTQNFVTVVQALSKYFGPASNTGLIMSYAGYQPSDDEIVLKPCAKLFDYVMTMEYGGSPQDMISLFNSYAAIVGEQNVMFGIGGDPWATQLSTTQTLAAWEPAKGNKGGMMEFDINEDTNYQAALAIIKALSSPAAATAR
ncbi:MAG TPA: glycosyl hydrolase family 18 protein [Pyrinomonadaceae bacterium]|jgi:hypothetical protein|nr:glycosyl hydrolase family 18 protein [Pyrinomonadaceae bacterium]